MPQSSTGSKDCPHPAVLSPTWQLCSMQSDLFLPSPRAAAAPCPRTCCPPNLQLLPTPAQPWELIPHGDSTNRCCSHPRTRLTSQRVLPCPGERGCCRTPVPRTLHQVPPRAEQGHPQWWDLTSAAQEMSLSPLQQPLFVPKSLPRHSSAGPTLCEVGCIRAPPSPGGIPSLQPPATSTEMVGRPTAKPHLTPCGTAYFPVPKNQAAFAWPTARSWL